jgi:aspartyl-tRNA(Asn)/glutamyl-tRNA(Gln) amidotransferase subunit C
MTSVALARIFDHASILTVAGRLTPEEVRHIAALARLDLTPPEVDQFADQLSAILAYAAEVERVDTTGVPPTSHPLGAAPVWRGDAITPGLDRDRALAAAPDANREAGLFRVPKVL